MTNALTTQPAMNPSLSLLMDPARFDHLQRVGRMLALSPLFPEHLRKAGMEASIANGALVMNMAYRLNEDPLTVAQNIYFVGGRPGWNTTYMIAKANQGGVFVDPIDWEIKGKGETLTVTAFGILARTKKRVEVTLDWDTAKKEGWTKNPKYQSIPEQMFRYRTAAFLIRLYCPEVMIGLPAQIEQELPMRDITPDEEMTQPVRANAQPPVEAKAVQPTAKSSAPAAEAPRNAESTEGEARNGADSGSDLFDGNSANADMEQFRGLLDLMLADLEQSGPDETEEVYAAQIEQMKRSANDLYKEWSDALTAAREKIAQGGE